MTSLSLARVYCARTLLGRRVCKRLDVQYVITLSCTWRIYALSERFLVLTVATRLAVVVELPGEDFTLNVSRIIVGKTDVTDSARTTFYGNFMNFYFDGERLFDRFDSDIPATPPTPPPHATTLSPLPRTLSPDRPITFPPLYIHHIRIRVSGVV